ncbi:helix-turn-helix transcriptional regulator [uncultured Kriegella sp.]|uniref:helix-turn-helix domain-containing protein n=1 Tax=uncultured Kriegella sp. TaxID=1798910 RepID=UPI0030DB6EF5
MNESEIRRIFERSNLSQADFAERIGKSTRTFQHYLKGETTPNSRVISKLKEIETELKEDRTKNTSY